MSNVEQQHENSFVRLRRERLLNEGMSDEEITRLDDAWKTLGHNPNPFDPEHPDGYIKPRY